LADALFLLGIPYGDNSKCLEFLTKLAGTMLKVATDTSEELAREKGSFPDYEPDLADFPSRRNSTLLSCAPTGTISGLVGCSYGIEPHFAPVVTRQEDLGRDVVSNPVIDHYMQEHDLIEFPDHARFVGGSDSKHALTTQDHLGTLSALAFYVDNAISKTVNLPKGATIEDVSEVYLYAHTHGIKGITVYRDGCREDQPVSWDSTEDEGTEEDACDEDDYDIEVIDYVANPKHRPDDVEGCTYKIKFNPTEPPMYITVNDLEDEPLEIFFKVNNAKHQEYLDGLSRAITSLWRRGIRADHLFEEFCEYESPNAGSFYEYKRGKKKYLKSILDAIGTVIKKHFRKLDLGVEVASQSCVATTIDEIPQKPTGEKCPECGEYAMVRIEGCMTCTECSYSKCG